jgi:1-aminocyclopropane-1-carboxylate synthase
MTPTPSTLSRRGAHHAGIPLRIDHAAFREAVTNHYHPEHNPDGALPMNIAENRLSWPELRTRLEEVAAAEPIPAWVPGYTSTLGAPRFREASAAFLGAHLTGVPIDPATLAHSAGATSVIEMTAFILADEGDVAAIPAPCYPVYRRDLGNFARVQRHDVVTHHEPSEIAGGPVLSVEHLERARAEVAESGRRLRMVILTTPDNPTGGVYAQPALHAAADWCMENEVHLVVNEIYGLSLIDTGHPALRDDYPEDVTFASFARIMAERKSDFLHLWYAYSKDLGISGLRVGLVHTHNAAFLKAYQSLNLTHSVSNLTQFLLGAAISDPGFMSGYIQRNQERLTASYATVVQGLRRLAIPYVPSRGSLFVWIDLSEFLREDSEAGELALWDDLFRTSGVLLTPGVGFGHTKRGMFRVVHPCVQPHELEVAMQRLGAWVEKKRGE